MGKSIYDKMETARSSLEYYQEICEAKGKGKKVSCAALTQKVLAILDSYTEKLLSNTGMEPKGHNAAQFTKYMTKAREALERHNVKGVLQNLRRAKKHDVHTPVVEAKKSCVRKKANKAAKKACRITSVKADAALASFEASQRAGELMDAMKICPENSAHFLEHIGLAVEAIEAGNIGVAQSEIAAAEEFNTSVCTQQEVVEESGIVVFGIRIDL